MKELLKTLGFDQMFAWNYTREEKKALLLGAAVVIGILIASYIDSI